MADVQQCGENVSGRSGAGSEVNGPRGQGGRESAQHLPMAHLGDKLGVLADPGDRFCQSKTSSSGLALRRSATTTAS